MVLYHNTIKSTFLKNNKLSKSYFDLESKKIDYKYNIMKLHKTKKAFTLIELMIVVVILWILMSTVLPKLTWAQARARDTARIADLSNISAALWVYYDDNGQFPSWWDCLSATWWTASGISIYMQNSVVPQDPQTTANQHLCSIDTWRYYYHSLTKDWLAHNAFVLCADMETYQKANTDASDLVWATAWDAPDVADSGTPAWGDWYEDAQDDVEKIWDWPARLVVDDADASHTVYCILRP